MDGALSHVPTADVPLLSALQQASGAHAAHSSFPDEDDLTSSSTYRSESRETTAEFSDYIETQSRWAWSKLLVRILSDFFARPNIFTASGPYFYVLPAVLRIRNVYPGYRIRIFSIPNPGSASKNFSILTKKTVSKLSEIWSGLFIPDPDPDFLPIPDPIKMAPDPEHCLLGIPKMATFLPGSVSASNLV